MIAEKRLYTEEEASDYFGWSFSKQRDLRKMGMIEHIQFNDQTIRYTIDQLENFQLKYTKSTEQE